MAVKLVYHRRLIKEATPTLFLTLIILISEHMRAICGRLARPGSALAKKHRFGVAGREAEFIMSNFPRDVQRDEEISSFADRETGKSA